MSPFMNFENNANFLYHNLQDFIFCFCNFLSFLACLVDKKLFLSLKPSIKHVIRSCNIESRTDKKKLCSNPNH